jgi:hypothetical protein
VVLCGTEMTAQFPIVRGGGSDSEGAYFAPTYANTLMG